MTFEATLERIATALELIATSSVLPSHLVTQPKINVEVQTPTEQPKKPARGRPAKISTDEKDAATPAVIEPKPSVDDFLDLPTPAPKAEKPATLEEVRAALQAYAAKNGSGPEGTGKARALMTKSSSNGAVRLNVANDVPGGDQGVLLVVDYAAVIKAALA